LARARADVPEICTVFFSIAVTAKLFGTCWLSLPVPFIAKTAIIPITLAF
jgi:hypothetical protein